MGIFENIELEEREVNIAPGDLLVFYTDGLTEAMDEEHHLFGEQRLHAVITAHPKASAQELLDAIMTAVYTFTNLAPQSDDLTLFVVKRQN